MLGIKNDMTNSYFIKYSKCFASSCVTQKQNLFFPHFFSKNSLKSKSSLPEFFKQPFQQQQKQEVCAFVKRQEINSFKKQSFKKNNL